MQDWLGLRNIAQSGTLFETPDLIDIPVTLGFHAEPTCPQCQKPMAKDGSVSMRLQDAPIWGKRVFLTGKRQRRRCRPCNEILVADSPDIVAGKKPRTKRLVRYVEDALTKAPATQVAKAVGLSDDVIRSIGHGLHERLSAKHRWATPDLLAVDNIKVGRGREYQVLFDQREGYAIGLVESGTADAVIDEFRRLELDADAIRVFSSDMSKANKTFAGSFKKALHVADRFHVYDACNTAVGSVLNARVAELKKLHEYGQAAALKAAKARLKWHRAAIEARGPASELQFDDIPDELARHGTVAAAYRARLQLDRIYTSPDRARAEIALRKFYALCEDPLISDRMTPALKYVHGHERQVLAYFDALQIVGEELWSPNTNALERRNVEIQDIWRSAKGYRKDFASFQLRVLYHRFQFGLHIIECDACGRFEGPSAPADVLTRSQQPIARPGEKRCSQCSDESGFASHSQLD